MSKLKLESEYNQEIRQSQTADKPLATLGNCPCMFKEQLYAYAISNTISCAGSNLA